MKILAIQRAAKFSPNSVEKDLAILEAVADRLRREGHVVTLVGEDHLPQTVAVDAVITMGRLPETLAWLKTLQDVPVVNAAEGIEHCGRCRLQEIMTRLGVPQAPEEGTEGYWLKRGDAAAQEKGDVVFATDRKVLEQAIRNLQQRGVKEYVVSAHVSGDLVKFYGVRGTGFFRYYYPTDDGQTKFGDEQRNGQAHHYPFDENRLQQTVDQLAEAVGIEVYGGDCIVRPDGSWCVIDFNDWPSFSRCREEAAEAIASLVGRL